MFRFVKIFGNQYLGFWIFGLILFAVQEIPYMVMPLLNLQSNPIMNMKESSVLLDTCEKILGSLCIAFMIFIVHKNAELFSVTGKNEKLFFLFGSACTFVEFCRVDIVFYRTSKYLHYDVFYCSNAPVILCFYRIVEK